MLLKATGESTSSQEKEDTIIKTVNDVPSNNAEIKLAVEVPEENSNDENIGEITAFTKVSLTSNEVSNNENVKTADVVTNPLNVSDVANREFLKHKGLCTF